MWHIPLLLFLLSSGTAAASTYQWTDDSGTVNFTDDYDKVPVRHREKVRHVEDSPHNLIPAGEDRHRGEPEHGTRDRAERRDREDSPSVEESGHGKHEQKKHRRHRRHDDAGPVIIETTPARRAQNQVEEQIRQDRRELDSGLSPARRALEQNEQNIRRDQNRTYGH